MLYKKYCETCIDPIEKAKALPLLFMRLVLAYGFYGPSMMKLRDLHKAAEAFASFGIPAPHFSTCLVATVEMLGAISMLIGLGTRIITIPLMIVMLVAIATVHWSHGFYASQGGFEIPLYYLIMLFTLFVYGSGKISFDTLVEDKCMNEDEDEAKA